MTTAFTIVCASCHAKFAGKPEYVGRRIRCPKCQEVFRVEAEPPAESVHSDVVVATALQDEFDEWNVPDDFEYKVKETDEGAAKCNFCHEPLRPGHVLCMKCGFHQKLNKKIETKRGEEADFGDGKPKIVPGHFNLGSLSIPTMPVAIGAGVAALMLLALFIIAPAIFGALCLLAGLLFMSVGSLWIVIVAFREDVFQGILVFFVPIYWWVYVFTRWEDTWMGFGVSVLGFFLTGFGIVTIGSGIEEPAAWLGQALYFSKTYRANSAAQFV